MERIAIVNPETTEGKSKELFDAIEKKLGMVPNMMKTMGHSPAVLNGYWSFSKALAQSSIGGKMAEQLALTVAGLNDCQYCLTAHSFIAAKILGMDAETILMAKRGQSRNRKTQLALKFATQLVEKKGKVSDKIIADLGRAGFNKGEILEIIAHTALNILTNFINNVSRPQIDFPKLSFDSNRTGQ